MAYGTKKPAKKAAKKKAKKKVAVMNGGKNYPPKPRKTKKNGVG